MINIAVLTIILQKALRVKPVNKKKTYKINIRIPDMNVFLKQNKNRILLTTHHIMPWQLKLF